MNGLLSKWNRGEGLLLLAVGVFALFFQLWVPSTHVDDADYQALAKVLETERQPGDVVLLAPWWTERARIYVPEGLPVVGFQGSDGEDLTKHPRIWVISEPRLPGNRLGEFRDAFEPERTAVGAERAFGNLRLQLFSNGRSRPVIIDATESLANAQVYLESGDGQRQPCAAGGNGFRCSNGKGVVREWHEVHFAPCQCVRMDAPGGATKQVVEFMSPAAGNLQLRAGYVWEWAAYKEGVTSSVVTAEVDGRVANLDLPAGVERMHRLPSVPVNAGSRVRLMLQSQNPNARVVCVTATVFGGAP